MLLSMRASALRLPLSVPNTLPWPIPTPLHSHRYSLISRADAYSRPDLDAQCRVCTRVHFSSRHICVHEIMGSLVNEGVCIAFSQVSLFPTRLRLWLWILESAKVALIFGQAHVDVAPKQSNLKSEV